MAEDIRTGDPRDGDLKNVHEALKRECAEQSRNTLYTTTTFYIWLRWLKVSRVVLWVFAAVSAGIGASTAVTTLPPAFALASLLGVIFPGVIKALKLDESIEAYEVSATAYKVAEGNLRRAAEVWSFKPFLEFEKEARKALAELEQARKPSLTPPEFCFRAAQRKVKAGDYDPDDLRSPS